MRKTSRLTILFFPDSDINAQYVFEQVKQTVSTYAELGFAGIEDLTGREDVIDRVQKGT